MKALVKLLGFLSILIIFNSCSGGYYSYSSNPYPAGYSYSTYPYYYSSYPYYYGGGPYFRGSYYRTFPGYRSYPGRTFNAVPPQAHPQAVPRSMPSSPMNHGNMGAPRGMGGGAPHGMGGGARGMGGGGRR